MFRNLKNKNVLMILLLLLILVSVFSYNMIQTTVEGFTGDINFGDHYAKFKYLGKQEIATKKYSYWNLDTTVKLYSIKPDTLADTSITNSLLEASGNGHVIYNDLFTSFVPPSVFSHNIYKYIDNSNIKYLDFKSPHNPLLDLSSIPIANDLSGTINILFIFDNSGLLYDLSHNPLNISLDIDRSRIIEKGKLKDLTTATSLNTGMTNAQILAFAEAMKGGNTDIVLPERDTTYSTSSMKNDILDYLLGNSGASFQDSGYHAPHYNSFESVMSNPSNPIVNPVNSMNPLDYSQSLIGPNVTPTMMQNMCKNSNTNKYSDFKNENDSEAENGANNGVNNGANNEAGSGAGSGAGFELQQPQTYTTSNMDSNTCQNCNGQQNSNNTCSSCENNNSILNGGGYSPHLPRPVLTNFSNFGN